MTLGKNHASATSPFQHFDSECQMCLSKECETCTMNLSNQQKAK